MSFTLKQHFTFGGYLPEILKKPGETISPLLQSPHLFLKESENYWMMQAFLAGMKNASISNPNPSVGCVIVKNNQLLASGCTEWWGGRHAEKVAFEKIAPCDLKGATVYLTLEPCTHVGKQPPCIELFQNTKLEKVIVGCQDPNPLVSGKGLKLLKEMGLGNVNLFLNDEITAWNYPFFIQQQQKRLFVALKWAQSLDGCFADDKNGWKWISGEKSRYYTHWLRQKYDAVLVGAGTVLNDFPSLDVLHVQHAFKKHPVKIIYDPEGKIFECNHDQQNLLMQKTFSPGTKKIIITNFLKKSKKYYATFKNVLLKNPEFLFLETSHKNLHFPARDILQVLQSNQVSHFLEKPLQSLFVEGGGRLLSSFVYDQIFDLIHVFVAPFFLGGTQHKLFSKKKRHFFRYPVQEVGKTIRYHIAVQEKLDEDILIELLKK